MKELRVLNLASNELSSVSNLEGLGSLTELNLRRNKVATVVRNSKTLGSFVALANLYAYYSRSTYKGMVCYYAMGQLCRDEKMIHFMGP